jgi:hypothetical protein
MEMATETPKKFDRTRVASSHWRHLQYQRREMSLTGICVFYGALVAF